MSRSGTGIRSAARSSRCAVNHDRSRAHEGVDRASVLEEELPVLGQRPEVVGDERLELVGDVAQRVLGRDDLVAEGARLGLDRAGLVGLVLGVLERRGSRRRASRPGRRPARRRR